MRVFFDLFYHSFAWTYDGVAALVSVGRWRAWTETCIPYLQGPRVLEIGHGPGHLQCQLAGRFDFVAGLDESPQMGRLARARQLRGGIHRLNLARGLAQALPYASARFDSVVSTFPSDYIYAEPTVRGVYRVLQDGGVFLILPAAWIIGRRSLDRAAAWLFRITGESPTEISSLISQKTIAPLERAGFEVEVKQVELRSSLVLILVARKASPGG